MFEFIRRLWRPAEYRYERPLSELVSLSLDKNTLEKLVRNIDRGKPISHIDPRSTSGIPYIEKILSEEVEKQFTEEYRPFIELVLNGIDARPRDHEGDYKVQVDIDSTRFSVEDSGKSMGLRDILQTFIIPFSTDKDRLQDIGRFGVGFFSNLIYCLEKPNEGKLVVETNDGENPYQLTFWSESDSVEGLRTRVQRGTKKEQGTKVEINGYPIDSTDLREYIKGYMKYFDPKRAQIRIGRGNVNPLPIGTTYWGDETFSTEQGDVSQTVRFTINPGAGWGNAKLRKYSQGVFIQERNLEAGEFRLDFPSAVEVVEGRDEFKEDENYRIAIRKAYDMIIQYAEKYGIKDRKVQVLLRDMVPSVVKQLQTSFGHQRTENLAKAIFPDRTYLLENEDHWDVRGDYNNAVRFFGRDVSPLVYKPKNRLASDFWREHFPGLSRLVQDETEVLAEGSLDDVREYAGSHDLPFNNSSILPTNHNYRLVNLKTGKGGFSPFISANGSVYVRAGDNFFKRPEDFMSSYGLFTTLQKALGQEEEKIENMILAR
jgi:hypothetical protein